VNKARLGRESVCPEAFERSGALQVPDLQQDGMKQQIVYVPVQAARTTEMPANAPAQPAQSGAHVEIVPVLKRNVPEPPDGQRLCRGQGKDEHI